MALAAVLFEQHAAFPDIILGLDDLIIIGERPGLRFGPLDRVRRIPGRARSPGEKIFLLPDSFQADKIQGHPLDDLAIVPRRLQNPGQGRRVGIRRRRLVRGRSG